MTAPERMPKGIAALRIDRRGYPVPWFVADVDGKPDFRIADAKKLHRAVVEGRCWVCGRRFTGPAYARTYAFVVGPMCGVNRTSSEPPSHWDCAEYSATHCPFLIDPARRRGKAHVPEEVLEPGGVMIERNPGVALVWATRQFNPVILPNGMIFKFGPPARVAWFAEGRPATRAEVSESVRSGLPALEAMAREDGLEACHALERQVIALMELAP